MADKGNVVTNTLSGIMGFIKPAQDAIGSAASGAANAVGGVAKQGAAIWGGLGPLGQVAAVATVAVGGLLAHNAMKSKEEENTPARGGFAEREMQRREAAGQYVGRR